MGKVKSTRKASGKTVREKALISAREEKFLRAWSLTRFCPRHLSF